MRRTLKYFFSLWLVGLIGTTALAQETKKDSVVPKTYRYGLRLGVDLYKIGQSVRDKNYKGIEFTGDYRISKNYYLAGEIGNENTTENDYLINYTAKGTYLKAGFDYNFYENWLDMENVITVGLRYSASSFSQTLNSYKIYTTNHYFDENPVYSPGTTTSGLSAQWFEVVVGMKAKVIQNFYLGFSFRMNKLFSNKSPANFDNLYIPGFNRTYGGSFGAGFNYTLSYLLPIYKKKEILPVKKQKN